MNNNLGLQESFKGLPPELLDLPNLILSPEQLCDVELLLNGGFAPLEGFLDQRDYESVLEKMRLSNDRLWPIPINLDVEESFASKLSVGNQIILSDAEGVPLALLTISSIWTPDKLKEAQCVFGTEEMEHPGVNFLINHKKPIYMGGKLEGFRLPTHYNFPDCRATPTKLKEIFKEKGWTKVLGFQTRNPMHKAHVAMTLYGAEKTDAKLLIHPVAGITKSGDIDYITRVKCYEKMIKHYPQDSAMLSLLPLAMRMAGPREALWHALIRKNYGCTHFLIGRDHAGCSNETTGVSYYEPYAAHELAKKFEKELGIEIIYVQEMVFVDDLKTYIPITEVKENQKSHVKQLSGSQLRNMLKNNLEVPDWFSYPEVIQELRLSVKPKHEQGFTIFFTGLSGAGKSTIANGLLVRLQELTRRPITLLDGDKVRQELSKELGFSKEHRDMNILRIGYVASEITKHRGIAICAPIAPYSEIRQRVREKISEQGGFIEVYMSTSLEVCEKRDRKGLYAKARAGILKGFTGIDDVYEVPSRPDITLNTAELLPSQSVEIIVQFLKENGYLLK